VVLAAMVLTCHCSSRTCLTDATRQATGWDPAEHLFRGDRFWLGGDSAYSIDLGNDRVLWLFGDSFVSSDGSGSRSGAPFARNSVAIQHGYDPTTATIDFHFRRDGSGTPTSFFPPDAPGTWFWPGHGARLGSMLFLFLWRMTAASPGAFGFSYDMPEAVLVANPDDDPSTWHATSITVPTNPWGVFLGTGAVLVESGYVVVLSCSLSDGHAVFAARWPVDAVQRGDLSGPEWATGVDAWTAQSAVDGGPLPLFSPGHTEFSVHLDGPSQKYVQIQATGFPGDIMMRTSPSITGPWSAQALVYHPPELACPDVLTYAGKAHPELGSVALDGSVAVSYASNSTDFAEQVHDLNLYFPRFVRLDIASTKATP
jgi:hypothetical protein